MAIFAVLYTYDDRIDLRDQERPAHRRYVRALADRGDVVAAGPLDAGTGGLLVVAAESPDAARDLLADDPFAVAGLIARTQVREWSPIIGALAHLV